MPSRWTFEAVQAGEQILENSGAQVVHDQVDRAFYDRAQDRIHLPPKEAFKDSASYYGTVLHEIAHNAEVWIMPINSGLRAFLRMTKAYHAA